MAKEPVAKTRGFGVPDAIDPHHFVVRIPRDDEGDIEIVENFGLYAESAADETIVRCRLPRRAWNGIREEVKRVLNDRLREKRLKTSRWNAGDNIVERLLGRELCLLAWAVEAAPPATYGAACAAWSGLKPEEKWWLFRMCDDAVGTADDIDIGWRKAVRIAFTETPGPNAASPEPTKRKRSPAAALPVDLFSLPRAEDRRA